MGLLITQPKDVSDLFICIWSDKLGIITHLMAGWMDKNYYGHYNNLYKYIKNSINH